MLNSNLYAEKIYAANPAILWALDDAIDTSPVDISSSIALTSQYGVPAYAYGRSTDYGYYLSPNTLANVAAINDGIPMVYGATNITTIYENTNAPSLIVPGFGFLNTSGKYKSFTLEFWLRANSDTHYPRKIVGPISSTDGIYVEGAFLKLKIGNSIGSHYIGEWGRPMIIHLTYNEYSSSLMVNGEQVISITLNPNTTSFPTKKNTSDKDQDWIGFYAYSNVTPVQLDCIALYPYVMSDKDAKLHFVWGQAVESPEVKNSGYSDVPVVIDYQMAKAANNYVYPGTGRWKNGTYNNLGLDNNVMGVPQYSLPSLVFEDPVKTLSDWYLRQGLLQTYTSSLDDGELLNNDIYFKMNPNPENLEWNSNGYINFPSLNILKDPLRAIYGVFEIDTDEGLLSEQILFKVTDNTRKTFEATIDVSGEDPIIRYTLKQYYDKTSFAILYYKNESAVIKDSRFVAGIDIQTLSSSNFDVQSFFNNKLSLSVQLGGNSDFTKMFSGKIYKFGLSNSQNFLKIASYFTDGIADQTKSTEINSHIGSYTLFGLNTMNIFSLDIAINGTWQDYIPLRLLSKNVTTDAQGSQSYKLDFMQFNVDYPEMSNVTNSQIRSYIAFTNLASYVPENLQVSRSTTVAVPTNKVVEPSTNWSTRRYEVKNDTVIYPPTNVPIENLGLITYLEFFIPGIIRNNLRIRNLHISSQAFDYTTRKTAIGTKYAKDLYSYKMSGSSKDFAGKNPFTLYKNSTPYLYLTKYSGIRLVGDSIDTTRGIDVSINKTGADYYKVGFVQTSILSDINFSSTAVEIYRISGTSIGGTEYPYIVYAKRKGTDPNKAYIYVTKGGVALADTDLTISINGIEIADAITNSSAIIRKNEWAMIGINFKTPLSFSGVSDGLISITGPYLINNLADYQIAEKDESNLVFINQWQDILGTDPETLWNAIPTTWQEVYFQSTGATTALVDGAQVYRSYIGSNRLQSIETGTPFSLSSYQYKLLSRVSSTIKIVKPL